MASGNTERHGRVQEYLGSRHTSPGPGAKGKLRSLRRNSTRAVLTHGEGGSDGGKVVADDRWLSTAAILSPMAYTWCVRKLDDCVPQLSDVEVLRVPTSGLQCPGVKNCQRLKREGFLNLGQVSGRAGSGVATVQIAKDGMEVAPPSPAQ